MRPATVALLLWQVVAQAQDDRWTLLKTAGDGTTLEADFNSAKPHWHGGYLIWTRLTFPHEKTSTNGQGHRFIVKQFIVQAWLNCKGHESGWKQQVAYNAAGETTLSLDTPFDPPPAEEPIPGSWEETTLEAICQQYRPTSLPEGGGPWTVISDAGADPVIQVNWRTILLRLRDTRLHGNAGLLPRPASR